MKRFILICVALIGLMAANASGTYHKTDQLQTHMIMQQDYQISMPAIIEPIQSIETVNNWDVLILPQNTKVVFLYSPTAYCNPDYGSRSLMNESNAETNTNIGFYNQTARHV